MTPSFSRMDASLLKKVELYDLVFFITLKLVYQKTYLSNIVYSIVFAYPCEIIDSFSFRFNIVFSLDTVFAALQIVNQGYI